MDSRWAPCPCSVRPPSWKTSPSYPACTCKEKARNLTRPLSVSFKSCHCLHRATLSAEQRQSLIYLQSPRISELLSCQATQKAVKNWVNEDTCNIVAPVLSFCKSQVSSLEMKQNGRSKYSQLEHIGFQKGRSLSYKKSLLGVSTKFIPFLLVLPEIWWKHLVAACFVALHNVKWAHRSKNARPVEVSK